MTKVSLVVILTISSRSCQVLVVPLRFFLVSVLVFVAAFFDSATVMVIVLVLVFVNV
jgi:hypothetical protein